MEQTCTIKGGTKKQRKQCIENVNELISSLIVEEVPADEVPDIEAIKEKAAKLDVSVYCLTNCIFFVAIEEES